MPDTSMGSLKLRLCTMISRFRIGLIFIFFSLLPGQDGPFLSMARQLHEDRLQGSLLPGKAPDRKPRLHQHPQKLRFLPLTSVIVDPDIVASDG